MIRQQFSANGYWTVIVFYDLDYNLFYDVITELEKIGAKEGDADKIYYMLSTGTAKAVTYSNTSKHTSIVVFTKHKDKQDYINSIVHEAEHVKQAMLKAYQVEDKGEPPAYTIGFLVGEMWKIFRDFESFVQ